MTVVQLFGDEREIVAMIGTDPVIGLTGYGKTAAEALRDLAANLENPKFKFEVTDLDEPSGAQHLREEHGPATIHRIIGKRSVWGYCYLCQQGFEHDDGAEVKKWITGHSPCFPTESSAQSVAPELSASSDSPTPALKP